MFDALYVHVPFCFHKCHYCDFYSITRQTPERMRRFVDLTLRESAIWAEGGPACQPTTIFFGGGTPSLLPIKEMLRLIDGLRARFDLTGVEEWTIECNPATVNADYLAALRSAGVNRLSFGAQSFNRDELAALERHHEPDDVRCGVELARSAGFERLNVDLIYAIPGQSLESWMRSLEAAVALSTDHLSCYGLTYETNTPIAVKKRLGKLVAAADSLELQMMHAARARLSEAGFEAYEISNYAKSGQACRHNLCYWRGDNYLGIGPSAASHLAGTRFRNRPHLGEWEAGIDASTLPNIDVEILSSEQRRDELAMTLLRLSRGIEFSFMSDRTGYDIRSAFAGSIDRLVRLGLLRVDDERLRLTDAGLNVADAVAVELVSG